MTVAESQKIRQALSELNRIQKERHIKAVEEAKFEAENEEVFAMVNNKGGHKNGNN